MEDYVSYEQAKLLKELGFDWDVEHFYDSVNANEPKLCRLPDTLGCQDNHNQYHGSFSAPTLTQVLKWFREKHNIDICIVRSFAFTKSYYYEILIDCDYDNMIQQSSKPNITYEKALSESINKSLEILNGK